MQCVPGECRIFGELLREILGPPKLERDGLTGESPAKGCPGDEGFGAAVLGGKAGRASGCPCTGKTSTGLKATADGTEQELFLGNETR